jgi:hypothetical protein
LNRRTMMAWCQVSGSVDGVFAVGVSGAMRATVMAEAEVAARLKAVAAGADPATCEARLLSSAGWMPPWQAETGAARGSKNVPPL